MFAESRRAGQSGARRGWISGLLLGLAAVSIGTAGATTLQEYFESDLSFAEGDLEFSDFEPVLKDGAVQTIWDTISGSGGPGALSSIQFLDFDNGVFSQGINSVSPANAGQIDLNILADDPLTPGFDPGFRLSSPPSSSSSDPSTWRVDSGSVEGAAQVSAFSYVVTTSDPDTKPITSAALSQQVVIEQLIPDDTPPDLAVGATFQFVMLPDSVDIIPGPGNPTVGNYALDYEILFSPISVQGSTPLSWVDTAILNNPDPVDAVKVVTVVALGATSEGIIRMDDLVQRIDPPPGSNLRNAGAVIPEPETVLLMLMGMLGLGVAHRRRV